MKKRISILCIFLVFLIPIAFCQSDNEINLIAESPETNEINPTHPEIPYLIVLGIVIALTSLGIYIYNRRKRKIA